MTRATFEDVTGALVVLLVPALWLLLATPV